jgi:glycosyltransferase involved in cell wall biosynthesis
VFTVDEPKFRSIAAPYNVVSGVAHAHMAGVVAALRSRDDIDVVHDHVEVVGPATLAAMGTQAPPTLQTLHWDLAKHREFYTTFDGRGRTRFAAVSRSQLDRAPENLRRQTMGVVPLGVPAPPAGLRVERGEHALVLARITADKGQDVAVRVCRTAGVPLVLAGPVAGIDSPEELHRRIADGDPGLAAHPDVSFYLREVAPLLDGDRAVWVGGVAGAAKERLLQSARALLAPNRWAEPGATGVVEALSRGVPVVATPRGVLTSLVEHGVTGYLAESEDDLAGYLTKVDAIDRDGCRASAAPWSPHEMARGYLELYDRLLREVG